MEYLIYRSNTSVAPNSTECRKIVKVSQRNNASLGLTGFLHAEQGQFIQYLEGPADPLWRLYERLFHDTRHTDILLLGHGELTKRRFEEWSMGYSDINVLSFDAFLKEVSFMTLAAQTSESAAIMFLMSANTRIDLGIADAPESLWR